MLPLANERYDISSMASTLLLSDWLRLWSGLVPPPPLLSFTLGGFCWALRSFLNECLFAFLSAERSFELEDLADVGDPTDPTDAGDTGEVIFGCC